MHKNQLKNNHLTYSYKYIDLFMKKLIIGVVILVFLYTNVIAKNNITNIFCFTLDYSGTKILIIKHLLIIHYLKLLFLIVLLD